MLNAFDIETFGFYAACDFRKSFSRAIC